MFRISPQPSTCHDVVLKHPERENKESPDFKSLSTREGWIDYSAFIIKHSNTRQIQICRPPRSGKTQFLSMLEYFYNKCPESESHAHLFHAFDIWKADERVKKKQGQHPVVSISFSSIDGENFETAYSQMQQLISNIYKKYLLDILPALPEHYRKESQLYVDKKTDALGTSYALNTLAQCLYKIHEKPVIFLIDDADIPFINSSQHGFYKEMACFINSLFFHIDETSKVQQIILTGTLPLPSITRGYRQYLTLLPDDRGQSILSFRFDRQVMHESLQRLLFTTHLDQMNIFLSKLAQDKPIITEINPRNRERNLFSSTRGSYPIADLLFYTGFIVTMEEYDTNSSKHYYQLRLTQDVWQLNPECKNFNIMLFNLITKGKLATGVSKLILDYCISTDFFYQLITEDVLLGASPIPSLASPIFSRNTILSSYSTSSLADGSLVIEEKEAFSRKDITSPLTKVDPKEDKKDELVEQPSAAKLGIFKSLPDEATSSETQLSISKLTSIKRPCRCIVM